MKNNYSRIIKTIGPGILFAGAAIGGSHLIQSTRAGADYGFQLLIIVILANLLKYPFFEFSYRYTIGKEKSLLEGYYDLGKSFLWIFTFISIITGIINLAALALGSSGLLTYILGVNINPILMSIILVISSILMLVVGKFKVLDNVMKVMVLVLSICTTIAFFMAINSGSQASPDYVSPDVWQRSGILFIVALMGWMPAPIEASAWTSLWTLNKIKDNKFKPTLKESLIDFYIGYVVTTILALFFLTLGAMIMYGTKVSFSNNGTLFAEQVIELYTSLFGKWSAVIIAPAAFITLLSSLITVIDGYPRSIADASYILSEKINRFDRVKTNNYIMITMSIIGLVIVSFMSKNLKVMIDLATIITFLAAPVLAYINYKVVTDNNFPAEYKPGLWLKIISWAGILFLSAFSLIFLYTLFFI
ncbi:divalent metal cation transporter [Candidatus Kapaibacterium sp.]